MATALLLLIIAARPSRAQQTPNDDRDAVPLSPQEYSQKLQLAEMYEETRDADNAVRLYQQLYHLNPNDENVFDGLTRSLIALKRYEETEKIVRDRMERDPSLETLLLYGRIEARMNKRSDALAAFERARRGLSAQDCAQLFPVIYAMMEVSYNQEALEVLRTMRSGATGRGDAELCSTQIAGLYLQLGDFALASKEFLSIIAANEGNVQLVEQRLAQYMTDSVSRATVLAALEKEILANSATRGRLQLLAWLYGERKDYAQALSTMLRLDAIPAAGADRDLQGFALLQFADRVRNEGALDVAITGYREAITRLRTSNHPQQRYFIAQAELGALKTEEAFLLSRPTPRDTLSALITRYEQYQAPDQMSEFNFEAKVRAGLLAYRQLFDLERAARDLDQVLTHSPGFGENARRAAFGLAEIALAAGDFGRVQDRLQMIEQIISRTRTPGDHDAMSHISYLRGLSHYYQLSFDTALVMLSEAAGDASSDYANDAIALSGLISENRKPQQLPALTLFAKAAFAEYARRYAEADSGYLSILRAMPTSSLADDAALRAAEMEVKLNRPQEAVHLLDTMVETMLTSTLLDQAAFRAAEITERELHDKRRAQRLYEDFLARFPNSILVDDARERARRLRGDLYQ